MRKLKISNVKKKKKNLSRKKNFVFFCKQLKFDEFVLGIMKNLQEFNLFKIGTKILTTAAGKDFSPKKNLFLNF